MPYSRQDAMRLWLFAKTLGIMPEMEEFEKRKLSIFNQLNFLGVCTGVLVPLIGLFFNEHLPSLAWFAAASPAAISAFVLWLNYEKYYEQSRLVYFTLYPIATCLVYLGKVDVGIELFFTLYCVMSVFFFQRLSSIFFSFSWSMVCYFLAVKMKREYWFFLAQKNYAFFLLNYLSSAGFILYALYLIKKENMGYQFTLLYKSREVHRRNIEIERQKQDIAEKAQLLEEQTRKLTELNQLKNKLFSVIAHDLKTPMYALRNLFDNMQAQRMSAREIKELVPAIAEEMNYTTSLMENLLHWAKTQMANSPIEPEVLEVESMIQDVLGLLHLQATNKQIHLESRIEEQLFCYADREMVNLVLRNLLSNAIKFTPENGKVSVGAREQSEWVEIYVEDTGIGIEPENMDRLFGSSYFTTKGTGNESGTGLGLKLCKEFLEKNGGQISVDSKPGQGSRFTVTLPRSLAAEVGKSA
jgi:two-component system, sensor histidine kinase and response regulator